MFVLRFFVRISVYRRKRIDETTKRISPSYLRLDRKNSTFNHSDKFGSLFHFSYFFLLLQSHSVAAPLPPSPKEEHLCSRGKLSPLVSSTIKEKTIRRKVSRRHRNLLIAWSRSTILVRGLTKKKKKRGKKMAESSGTSFACNFNATDYAVLILSSRFSS